MYELVAGKKILRFSFVAFVDLPLSYQTDKKTDKFYDTILFLYYPLSVIVYLVKRLSIFVVVVGCKQIVKWMYRINTGPPHFSSTMFHNRR
jgi:hypothetical protein